MYRGDEPYQAYGHTTQIIAKKIPKIMFKGHKAESPLD